MVKLPLRARLLLAVNMARRAFRMALNTNAPDGATASFVILIGWQGTAPAGTPRFLTEEFPNPY
jgi:hypothetical protein